ncbi:MAG TPA: YqgE/AlgH family protein [Nocardioidaceae bacterium]|nr:YqgE/AlgH family protein [Nocardioidaceae bacterium]
MAPDSGDVADVPRWWTGQLLVASPSLTDPHFARAVVLVLDHDDDGALGVVLDRPSELAVEEVLPGWAEIVDPPPTLFAGGPVSTGSALGVAVLVPGTAAAPLGWRRVFGDTGLLDLDTPMEVLADALAGLRIFAGYSGWSPGQLEAEVAEGAWFVVPAQPGDLLCAAPEQLWGQVLRRQGGRLALLATFPDDPLQN